jgi:hypothetical protein
MVKRKAACFDCSALFSLRDSYHGVDVKNESIQCGTSKGPEPAADEWASAIGRNKKIGDRSQGRKFSSGFDFSLCFNRSFNRLTYFEKLGK